MTKPNRGGKKPSAPQFPSLLELLRTENLYQLLRALLAGEIEKLLVPGVRYFSYPLDGDDAIVNDQDLATLTGTIAATLGRSRLKLTIQRSANGGLETMRLPPKVQTALMLEMTALLANLSAADVGALPQPLDVQRAAAKGAADTASGFTMSLFEAMDCADHVAIDGCEMGERFQELSQRRRRVSLASGEDLMLVAQRIRVCGGCATFEDADGAQRSIRLISERPLEPAAFAIEAAGT